MASKYVPRTLVIIHRSSDRAGIHRITPDAMKRELDGDVLHQSDHTVLADT